MTVYSVSTGKGLRPLAHLSTGVYPGVRRTNMYYLVGGESGWTQPAVPLHLKNNFRNPAYLRSYKLCILFCNISRFTLILKQCLKQYLACSEGSINISEINKKWMNEIVPGYFEVYHIIDKPWRHFSASLPLLLLQQDQQISSAAILGI